MGNSLKLQELRKRKIVILQNLEEKRKNLKIGNY